MRKTTAKAKPVPRAAILRDLPPLEDSARATPKNLDELQTQMGHKFSHIALLEQALTHASLRKREGQDNETLEFLGDRVLGLIIARILFARGEGVSSMADRFKVLVSGVMCARIAHLSGMTHLLRSDDSLPPAGRLSDAVAADLCEAVIAAIYLDAGMRAARAFVVRFWKPYLHHPTAPAKDAKSVLQEEVQKQTRALPVYKVIDREGPKHGPHFTVEVVAEGLGKAQGKGASRRAAEQNAAAELLAKLHA